jgi:hypothetical protein
MEKKLGITGLETQSYTSILCPVWGPHQVFEVDDSSWTHHRPIPKSLWVVFSSLVDPWKSGGPWDGRDIPCVSSQSCL